MTLGLQAPPRSWRSHLIPRRSVGLRFAMAILLFSLAVAMLATGLRAWLDYRADVRNIEDRLQQIESSSRESLAASLWNLDHAAATLQVAGIAHLPDLVSVRLAKADGEIFVVRGAVHAAGALSREVALWHEAWGEKQRVGSLHLQASLAGPQARMRQYIYAILSMETAKVLLLSLFVIAVFQRMLGRYLARMAWRIAQTDASGMPEPFELHRPSRYNEDELGRMESAFLQMQAGLHEVQTRLMSSERRANTIIDNLVDGLIQIDAHGRIERVNAAAVRMFGHAAEELLGENVKILMGEPYRSAHDRYLADYARSGMARIIGVGREVEGLRSNGERFPMNLSVAQVELDHRRVYIGLVKDLSEAKAVEAQLWRTAHVDALTELPNRLSLLERLTPELERVHRTGAPVAVLVVNLDRFKEINDSMGMAAGDAVLRQVAGRLQIELRSRDTLARLGSDEFAVIVSGRNDLAQVEHLAEGLRVHLSQPFQVEGKNLRISVSIGITVLPIDRADAPAAVLRNAEQAMHTAKREGGNRYRFFKEEMQRAAQERLGLIQDLNQALDAGQFFLVYQPVILLQDGAAHKAEALIRWNHPERGLVSPAGFIPLAEETGLIHPLGNWVFREAADAVAALRGADSTFQVAINTSPAQYDGHMLAMAQWMDYLRMLNLSGDSIVVEITEGLLMGEAEDAHAQLLRFRDAGVQVAIDDFGTGYSSLSYLKRFDIDYLKIDQSFVRQLAPGSSDLVLCEAMIVMAHRLGIKVIAEGIETEAQYQLLKAAGCDLGQGYFFARPMPLAQLQTWLADQARQRGGACP